MRRDVLLKLIKISLVPLIIGLIYAGFQFYLETDPNKSIISFLTHLAGAFFFVMWISGQYLRTKKSIDDNQGYSDIQTGLTEIKNSIESLSNLTTAEMEPIISTNSLLTEAKEAVSNGFVLAGLMQAGVAFEQAIIEKAQKHNIEVNRKTPIAKALKLLSREMDKNIIGELFAIWQLRNKLVHLTPDASEELKSNPELIKYFDWGISELEK